MGTNYYLHRDVCPQCGRGDEPLHIGKSSAGWCFSLHVCYPDNLGEEEVPADLDGWKKLWEADGVVLKDEYGKAITPAGMLAVITKRSFRAFEHSPIGYRSWESFHNQNHSVPGPNGLVRHRIEEGHCIAHGEGTYDCVVDEFS